MAALLAGAFFAVLGFAGLDLEDLGYLNRVRQTAEVLAGARTGLAASLHPGADLVGSFAILTIPVENLRALWLFSLLCMAGSVGFVVLAGHRAFGRSAGAVAGLFYAGSVAVTAAATTATAAAPVALAWALLLALAVRPRWTPLATLAACLGAGFLLLAWPPAAIWGVLWFAWSAASFRTREHVPRGTTGTFALPPGLVLFPIGVLLLACLLHPAFWGTPLEMWKEFLEYMVAHAPEKVMVAGEVYDRARPPLWSGAGLWLLRTSPLFVLPALLGLAQAFFGSSRRPRADRFLAATFLLVSALPWLQRSFDFGEIPILLVLAAPASLLAALPVARALDGASPRARIVTGVLLFAFVGGTFVTSVLAHPRQDRYFNLLAGDAGEAAKRYGGPPSHFVPVHALREAADKELKVCATRHAPLVDELERGGFVDNVWVTPDCLAANVTLAKIIETGELPEVRKTALPATRPDAPMPAGHGSGHP